MTAPWFIVARREFLERVRTKWFVVVTLLGPIAMAGLLIVPAWLAKRSAEQETRISVVDHSARDIGAKIATVIGAVGANIIVEPVDVTASQETLQSQIRDKRIAGYLIVPKDVLTGGDVVYRGSNATNLGVVTLVREIVNIAVQSVRAIDAGMNPDQIAQIMQRVPMQTYQTTGGAETSGEAVFVIAYGTMFLLYMAVLLYAVNVLRSVIQEKATRVVELLIAAIRPRSLLVGKLFGVGSVGLCQFLIWGLFGVVLYHYRVGILGLFGVTGGGFELPSITLGTIALILLYFVLGFFFYASIYAAIGSMVNSEQDAQQVQTPMMLLLIVPLLCMQLVANDPRGLVAEVLTLFPISSPVLMPMRYLLGGSTVFDLALSIAILAISIAGSMFVAARIYRVGILMYGKRPTLRELWRWVRFPES